MSTKTALSTVTAEPPSTLTITQYQQMADRFLEALDALSSIAPALGPEEAAQVTFTRRHVNVPVPFLATTLSSIERNPELQNIQKLNVAVGRDTLQLIEAFRPVIDSTMAFLNRLTLMVQTRQAALTVEALNVYDVAKSLDRDARSPELTVAVENMKRDLGRRGGRSAVPPEIRKAAKIAAAQAAAAFIAAATAGSPPPPAKATQVTEPRATAARP